MIPEFASIVVAALAFAVTFGVVRYVVSLRAKKKAKQASDDDRKQQSRQVRRARERKGPR